MKTVISNGMVITPYRVIEAGTVFVENGKIRLPGNRVVQNLRQSGHAGTAVEEELLEKLNTLARQQRIALVTAD
jgi:LDH2 family malate/lactate/ureidoglycolate dehydrogenase